MNIKRKIDNNSLSVMHQKQKVVITKPVAGNMYVALEDGRLVPVNTAAPIITPLREKFAINPAFVPLNQEPSISDSQAQSREMQIKMTKLMSLTLDQTEQLTSNKHKAYSETVLGPNKRLKIGDTNASAKQNVKVLPNNSPGISDSELMDQESKSEDNGTEIDYNFSDTSFAGSEGNEYTTPEYLDDELFEDENSKNNSVYVHNEDTNSSELDLPVETLSSKVGTDNKRDSGEEELSESIAGKLTWNKITETVENIKPGCSKSHYASKYIRSNTGTKTAKSSVKSLHTTQHAHSNISGGTKTNMSGTTPKAPRINDKFPELPVPANLNQYGDCLKTRLGRYHYGLTLNDPPCQFFQGVLKGASGQTLAAMFGDTNLISKFEGIPLDTIGHFAIDTTFRVIPNSTVGVNHVLTVSLIFQNQNIPLWYAITSCSSPELYKRILIEFQQHVLDWPFTSVVLNNDPALCKAVKAVFPDIDFHGSWFHYCHSIWKELSLNKLVEVCKADITMLTAVKLLMVVPYLPPLSDTPSSITMLEGLEVVRNFAHANSLPKEFDKVLDYVAAFWFNIVKSKNFTVFGKQTSSLNYIEVFQLALLSYMKPDGNVWTLTSSFQSVARTANLEFNRYLNGKPFLAKKNRGKKFNVPIRQNMKRLLVGTYNVKTYLEKSTIYCEEMLDIFLHPLYPTTISEKSNYTYTEGWKIRINNK